MIACLSKLSNNRVAIAQQNGNVKIFNIDSGKKEKTVSGNKDVIKIIEISGNRLVIISCQTMVIPFEAIYGPTIIKIYNLNNFVFRKSNEITINPQEADPVPPQNIIYLKDDRLIVTFPDRSLLVNLSSGKTVTLPFTILYAKKTADGNFVCKNHIDTLIILNPNLELIDTIKINSIITNLKLLGNKKSFIISSSSKDFKKAPVLMFTNEKFNFDEIRKNLMDKIPINDLQKIVLDYLGDRWQNEIVANNNRSNESYLNNFNIILNNNSINRRSLNGRGYCIEIWAIFPPKFIKTIKQLNLTDKVVSFKDGTIVIGDSYKVRVLEPIFRV